MMMFAHNTFKRNTCFKRVIVFVICSTLLSKTIYSQDAHGIIISSVGLIGNLSNNSMPIGFSSKNGCINIQNGVAVLIGDRSKGEFVISCKTPVKLNILGAMLYPNPVVNKTTVRLKNKPMIDEDFMLTVWSIEGASLLSERVNATELLLGKVINLGGLTSGMYLITVESSRYTEAIKFIKAN